MKIGRSSQRALLPFPKVISMQVSQLRHEGKSELRREAGRWLKERREACGLSQRQLAELVGVDYYTFVSQLETGRGRIPPERYRVWAHALRMPAHDFVKALLPYYESEIYDILFGETEASDTGR